MEGKMDKFTG
jgi:hypothetical protein